jgi:transcriptional regulator with XRE-family HTH domain/predicted XRE-type DNA-binding protein
MTANQKEDRVYVQNLKDNVKGLVRNSKKSASEIADKIGMNQSNFSKCLKDETRCFSIVQVCKLAKLFDCSVDELVGIKHSSKSDTENIIIKNIRILMDNVDCQKIEEPTVDSEGIPLAPTFLTPSYSFDNKDLGEIVGMSESEVSKCLKIENGSKFFSLEQIKQIADYFGVSVDFLMGRKVRSNYEICEFLSILLEDGRIDIKEEIIKEKKANHYASDEEEYRFAQDYKSRIDYGFINERICEENEMIDEEDVKYQLLLFPKNRSDYYDKDQDKYVNVNELNQNNVIINNCLAKLVDAHNKLDKGIYDKEDFDAIVKQALIKTDKLFHKVHIRSNADDHRPDDIRS